MIINVGGKHISYDTEYNEVHVLTGHGFAELEMTPKNKGLSFSLAPYQIGFITLLNQ